MAFEDLQVETRLNHYASQENCDGPEYDCMVEAAREIKELKKRIAELERLLRVAACPEECANGVIADDYQVNPGGEAEWILRQCQFCHEREMALPPGGDD
jgi:hypothetical protein